MCTPVETFGHVSCNVAQTLYNDYAVPIINVKDINSAHVCQRPSFTSAPSAAPLPHHARTTRITMRLVVLSCAPAHSLRSSASRRAVLHGWRAGGDGGNGGGDGGAG